MQFLTIYKPAQGLAGTMPSQEHMNQMRDFVEESRRSGVLVATGSFQSGMDAGTMRLSNGMFTVGDAPAYQSEMAGFAILKTQDEEQLEGIVKRFLSLAGDGECQILRLQEVPQQ